MQNRPVDIFSSFSEISLSNPKREIIYFFKDSAYASLTYRDLYGQVAKLARLIEESGAAKQDPVAIILENTPLWPVAFFALMKIGAIAVPLNPQLEINELAQFLRHAEAKLILTSQNLSQELANAAGGLNTRILILDSSKLSEGQEGREIDRTPAQDMKPDHIASIVYTSGTTSVPKGVVLTHRNFLSNMGSLNTLGLITPSDTLISILPFYHTYPFMVNLLLPLLIGGKISFPQSLDMEEITECIKKTHVTIMTGVPRIFSLFHAKIEEKIKNLSLLFNLTLPLRKYLSINLPKLILAQLHDRFGKDFRFFVSGGAKLDRAIAKSFYKWGFTIIEGYGLTETSPVVSFNLPKKNKICSVGKPIPGIKVQIHEPDPSGTGEIIIKGESVFRGYYKEEALTKEAIKDGWFYTGDLGYLDKEGFLYIAGRNKEMLVFSSGKKIVPEDLENYYTKSQFIKEIYLFLSGDRLSAVIVPDQERFTEERVIQIKDRIRMEIEQLSAHLPSYQRINKYIITNEPLPRTALGKMKRYEIEAKYSSLEAPPPPLQKISAEDELLLSLDGSRQAIDAISRLVKKQAALDDHLELDLGFDSLSRIELFLELHKLTGIEIREKEAAGIFTVREILNKLRSTSKSMTGEQAASGWQQILKMPLEAESRIHIAIRQSLPAKIINLILLAILKLPLRILFPAEIIGLKNLAQKGPYLICANHYSYLDGPLLACALPLPVFFETYFMGFAAIFNQPVLRQLQKTCRLLPVDPASNIIETLKVCAFLTNNSKIVCIFPEGGRSRSGQIEEFKRGIGIITKELNIPILPVYIEGTYTAWPSSMILPRPHKVKIIFGEKLNPQYLSAGVKEDSDIYKKIADNLRREIIKLSH